MNESALRKLTAAWPGVEAGIKAAGLRELIRQLRAGTREAAEEGAA